MTGRLSPNSPEFGADGETDTGALFSAARIGETWRGVRERFPRLHHRLKNLPNRLGRVVPIGVVHQKTLSPASIIEGVASMSVPGAPAVQITAWQATPHRGATR
jgi:hypothetical protein